MAATCGCAAACRGPVADCSGSEQLLSRKPRLLSLPHDRPIICPEAPRAHELSIGAAKRVGRQVPAVRDSRVLQW
jgi:hypothetical protein